MIAIPRTPKSPDATVSYSRGFGMFDNSPEQREACDYDTFRAAIIRDRGTAKGEQWICGPCGAAAEDAHHSEPSRAAAIGRPHRCKHCVQDTAWINFDVDGASAGRPAVSGQAFHCLVALLQPLNGVVHTTASHTPEEPRCRITLMLSRAVSRAERKAISKKVRDLIDDAMAAQGFPPLPWDPSCDNPEQPTYLPLIEAAVYELDGSCIDADEILRGHEPRRPDTVEPAPVAAQTAADHYALASLDRALRNISLAAPGTRNDVLNREAFGMGGFVAVGRLSRVLVEGALIDATRSAGWDDDAGNEGKVRSSVAAGMAEPRSDGLPDEIKAVIGPRDEASRAMVRVDLSDLRLARAKATSFVLKPIIPCGIVTLLGGHGGTGKSSLALAWAAHVACGRSWAGFECVRPRKTLVVSLEDKGDIVKERLNATCEAYGLDYELVLQNLVVLDGADIDAALVTETNEYGTKKVRPTARLAEISRWASDCEFIVIDNASDAFDADENNRRQVRTFIRLLAQLAASRNAGMVLLAHVDKQAALKGAKGNSYSGSTAWHNSARSRLAISVGKAGAALRHEKANYSGLAAPVHLVRKRLEHLDTEVWVPASLPDGFVRNHAAVEVDEVLGLVDKAIRAGIEVPAALRGSSTAIHALMLVPEAARHGDKVGQSGMALAITRLLADGLMEKTAIKTSSRNVKDVLRLTEAGRARVENLRASHSALYSATDARAANSAYVASVVPENHESNATDESHALAFVFSPHTPFQFHAEQ